MTREQLNQQVVMLLTAAGYDVGSFNCWCYIDEVAVFDAFEAHQVTVSALGEVKRVPLEDLLDYVRYIERLKNDAKTS